MTSGIEQKQPINKQMNKIKKKIKNKKNKEIERRNKKQACKFSTTAKTKIVSSTHWVVKKKNPTNNRGG